MFRLIHIAIDEARRGMQNNHGGPFGAVIVKDGGIISTAHNEVLSSKDPTAHAEILAIRRASQQLGKFDLSDCEIFTTSQPCPMCFAAICWARIKRIHYGTTTEEVAIAGFDDSHIYNIIKGEQTAEVEFTIIQREACLELLQEWDNKTDKQMY
ncbi:cytosine/adenosine deaminase [Methanomethylovorans hollandica DSM 15978]|uniref:Cytosine/adenosine deaminase n=1 Tax=Methanomethylovorans hollandica (strain DSM 15978 / NBRC 107637 / DMS1) TaxID=867904 RepID=L0KZ64_METHD|nr:nucleoside deaminase [Methanomethylovorans hollandica]AGB49368.1 cytosine/adenosine deaminase [Methanomethylovorans hollandica DSM 15978]